MEDIEEVIALVHVLPLSRNKIPGKVLMIADRVRDPGRYMEEFGT